MNSLRTIFLLLVLGTLALGCNPSDGAQEALEPETHETAVLGDASTSLGMAPDFSLPTLAGDTLSLADLRGKVVLLNFWATWCAPCVQEIPELVDLHKELQSSDLVVVGVAIDEEGEELVGPFAHEFNINYPIVLDTDGAVTDAYGGVWALPTTYVINAEGEILERVVGLYPVAEKRPALRALVHAPAPASGG